MTKTLRDLLDDPLRKTHLGGHRKQFSFDPEEAVRRWMSGEHATVKALAAALSADPRRVKQLLRARGVIE